MPGYRKLGRPSDQRNAMLKNLVTALIQHGRIETTQARAKEVQKIVDGLIALAVKEKDNFTSKSVKISAAKLDTAGRKITKAVTSKNGNKYNVVEREEKTDMVSVDNPSRLSARRKMMKWLDRPTSLDGKKIALTNHLFDTIAPNFVGRSGGYTRIFKLGPRRGDAAEMAILELVQKVG